MLELAPDALVASVAPWEPLHTAGQGAPPPLVLLDGAASAWERVAAGSDGERARARLAASPWLTVGVVRGGDAPSYVDDLLDACDLRAVVGVHPPDGRPVNVAGDAELVERTVAAWSSGVARSPHACLVGAQVLRADRPSLLVESLAYSALQAGPAHRAWLAQRNTRPADVDRAQRRVSALARDGGREVVLSRPDKRNAFDAQMREELCDVLDALEVEQAAPVILRGEGPSFCAGGDLDEFGTVTDPVTGHLLRTQRSVATRLHRLAGRCVAAVHGASVGAGVEFAAFARRVVAAADAVFQLPEAALGLIPGAGGTVSLPARIGRHRTLELLVTGATIDAETARCWGLVDEVVPPGELVRRAWTVGHQLARQEGGRS